MSEYDISVIVPVFNAENSIVDCLDSIRNQNYTNWECIVIDDGSTDASGKICDSYAAKDDRFKVYHKKNGGVSTARNLGLEKATGKWIAFIDSDDIVEQNYLIGFDDKVDLYVQDRQVLGDSSYDWPHLSKQYVDENHIVDYIEKNGQEDVFRAIMSKIFKSEIIKAHEIRFIENIRFGEDTLFVNEFLKYCKRINVINTSNYVYNKPLEWRQKYSLSFDDAISFLKLYHLIYKSTPIHCKKQYLFELEVMKSAIGGNNEKSISLQWFLSKPVMNGYKEMYPNSAIFYLKYLKRILLLFVGKS